MTAEVSAKEGLVLELSRFVQQLSYEEVPVEAREITKTRVLDTLSCCHHSRPPGPQPPVPR